MDETRGQGRRAQEDARERKIMRAAIEELALSDFGGLTIEQVALRAGVNKTTVYRKWETKADLIRAALFAVCEMFRMGPTSGDLRADLLCLARNTLAFLRSYEGQSLMRLRLLDHPEPQLAQVARDLMEQQMSEPAAVMRAAVQRGELAADADSHLLLDMLFGAIHVRVVLRSETVSEQDLVRMVDHLLRAMRQEGGDTPAPRSGAGRRNAPGRGQRAR
jgi:AcrR family transcriptional regulator